MDDAVITEWALAARSGDRDAAAAFIRATGEQLRRVLGYLAEYQETEDLVQETYLRAFAALEGYAGQAPARLWLLSIARRVAADHVRSRQRRPRTSSLDTHTGHAQHARPSATGRVELSHTIAELAPERRDAFVLTQVLGLSYAEAGEVCGCAVGTIRSRVYRARADLVSILTTGEEPGSASEAGPGSR